MNFSHRKQLIALTLFIALAVPAQVAAQSAAKHDHYKLIDLGTFGGPASYFANGSDGILNNRGTAVGWADTSTPDPFPAFCFNLDCFISHAFRSQNGIRADLGTLPGGASSQASWISANGLIIGLSQNGQTDPLVPGFPELRAVLWKYGEIIDLGTLEGGYESLANAVNNRGQVVGGALNTIPDPFSMVGLGYQVRAFLWQDGVMQDLGTLGGPDAFAFFVNERGRVAGQSYTNSTPNPVTGIPTQDPFLWENGGVVDLGTLGGTLGFPTALNNRDQVVGRSNLAGDLAFHPFLWDHGVLSDLNTLGGNTGIPNWINDAGDIVGKADLPGPLPQNHDAVLWKDGAIIDLGTLPNDSCSNAYFVNSKGQVVGTSESRKDCTLPSPVGEHAFLWERGGPMVDLNKLIPPHSALQLTYAVAINDRGEIAGFGVPPGVSPEKYETQGHAYLLIPCDENHADVEDCDHEPVNASSAAQIRPAQITQTPAAGARNAELSSK
jgi:probable HAF family extracellular repeat protein